MAKLNAQETREKDWINRAESFELTTEVIDAAAALIRRHALANFVASDEYAELGEASAADRQFALGMALHRAAILIRRLPNGTIPSGSVQPIEAVTRRTDGP
jgi:hypothetical protein